MSNQQPKDLLPFHKEEYTKLKDEQIRRIGFRDNLIYVTLAAFGGIISFYFAEKTYPEVLLVLPWVSIILGWTYLKNDEKVTSIGRYIRKILGPNILRLLTITSDQDDEQIFKWESYRLNEEGRTRRKILQLFINAFIFISSGFASILMFVSNAKWPIHYSAMAILIIESLCLLYLLVEFVSYADFRNGASNTEQTKELLNNQIGEIAPKDLEVNSEHFDDNSKSSELS